MLGEVVLLLCSLFEPQQNCLRMSIRMLQATKNSSYAHAKVCSLPKRDLLTKVAIQLQLFRSKNATESSDLGYLD